MKRRDLLISALVLLIVPLVLSCATFNKKPPRVTKGFATPVSYKDGKHPGVDFGVRAGTPIIASADGTVKWILDESDKPYSYALFVIIEHGHYAGKRFYADYGHLSKIFVSKEEQVKRGQLIGLIARSKFGPQDDHLHFGLHCGKTGIENHYDPKDFWLGGKPQCFDPNRDYSNYTNIELTHPVACGEYGRVLAETDPRVKKK